LETKGCTSDSSLLGTGPASIQKAEENRQTHYLDDLGGLLD